MEDLKVLFIIGKGRSGSTLLDNALNEVEGVFSAGELVRTWRWQPLDEYVCGCGARLGACPVWAPVIQTTYERLSRELGRPVSTRDALAWERSALRWSRVPYILWRRPHSFPRSGDLRDLAHVLAFLYRALASATGARVLVDSSKWPAHPGALGLVPGIRPYVLHLVRDPRAVAFSWQREKPYPAYGESMPKFGVIYSALSWTARNVLAHRVRRRAAARGMRLRYEDFVAEPAAALEAVLRLLGERVQALPLSGPRTLRLGPNHTAMGNPGRFDIGDVEVRPDDEWVARLRRRDAAIVTALTWPLLLRYGYPLSAATRTS